MSNLSNTKVVEEYWERLLEAPLQIPSKANSNLKFRGEQSLVTSTESFGGPRNDVRRSLKESVKGYTDSTDAIVNEGVNSIRQAMPMLIDWTQDDTAERDAIGRPQGTRNAAVSLLTETMRVFVQETTNADIVAAAQRDPAFRKAAFDIDDDDIGATAVFLAQEILEKLRIVTPK